MVFIAQAIHPEYSDCQQIFPIILRHYRLCAGMKNTCGSKKSPEGKGGGRIAIRHMFNGLQGRKVAEFEKHCPTCLFFGRGHSTTGGKEE